MLEIIRQFLDIGFQNKDNIKVAYCATDGFINIMQNYNKTKGSQTATAVKFLETDIEASLEILSQYLNKYCNNGIYTGVSGAMIDTIIRLDLGIQLSVTILNAKLSDDTVALEKYLMNSTSPKKSELISQFIQWIFLNYCG